MLSAGFHRSSQQVGHQESLDAAERLFVTRRLLEAAPKGDFDLAHLKAIRRHLFQDVYEWADEVRAGEIVKSGSRFQPRRFIEAGMADIHRRVVAAGYFQGTSPRGFADRVGPVLGDVNHVHPFREGNGRTQLLYLKQLAQRAGLDLTQLDRDAWKEASRRSNAGEDDAMTLCIQQALV